MAHLLNFVSELFASLFWVLFQPLLWGQWPVRANRWKYSPQKFRSWRVNPFIPEFLKWTFPALNLVKLLLQMGVSVKNPNRMADSVYSDERIYTVWNKKLFGLQSWKGSRQLYVQRLNILSWHLLFKWFILNKKGLQWTLVTTTVFVPTDVSIKMNLL